MAGAVAPDKLRRLFGCYLHFLFPFLLVIIAPGARAQFRHTAPDQSNQPIAKCAADREGEGPSCIDISPVREESVEVGCSHCRAERIAQRILDPSIFAPECVFPGFEFKEKQYDAYRNESFCVSVETGVEHEGSRRNGTTVDCSQYKAELPTPCFAKRSSRFEFDFEPSCMEDGYYDVQQCAGIFPARFCWCTGKLGQTVPKSFHKEGTKPAGYCSAFFREFQINCEGKEGTFLPHPTDCTRYIECSTSGTFSCVCGNNEAWDRKLGSCNHASMVPCQKPAVTNSPSKHRSEFERHP